MRLPLLLLVLILAAAAAAEENNHGYPFSGVIDWTNGESRQNYERVLEKNGVTIERKLLSGPQFAVLAEKTECLTLRRDSLIAGYGIVFSRTNFVGRAGRGFDDRVLEINLHQAEILGDLDGHEIFLVTYSVRLNPLERFFAKILGYDASSYRKIFTDADLGEGYKLDAVSSRFVRELRGFLKICRA